MNLNKGNPYRSEDAKKDFYNFGKKITTAATTAASKAATKIKENITKRIEDEKQKDIKKYGQDALFTTKLFGSVGNNSNIIKNTKEPRDLTEDFKKYGLIVDEKDIEQELKEKIKEFQTYLTNIVNDTRISRSQAFEYIKEYMNEIKIDDEDKEKYLNILKVNKFDFNINEFSSPKSTNPELDNLLKEFRNIANKNSKGYAINKIEKNKFDNIINEITSIGKSNKISDEEINYAIEYVTNIKSNVQIKSENVIDTNKEIIQFKQLADICKLLIIILVTICIVIFLIVFIISLINVFNLLLKIILSIIILFYNSFISNNQTLSYTAKNIIKCSKNNYSDDIFNILNEQFTSLSVFNTSLYIIYILLAYIILYIIAVIYVRINSYTHILKGELRDIDPKYQLLTIVAIIFISCFIHLLIYKLFFKELSFNKFRQIHNYEIIIDNIINKNLSPVNKEYDENFFILLTDSTKRNEIDRIFLSKINDIEQPSNNIGKYLFMYDIYMYFDEYIYMNDVIKEDIKSYFKIGETPSNRTFISFLDSNERKLIKLYHEDLPFYNQIPAEKLGTFQKINEQVNKEISGINKLILKYSGTFYPFLFACIYIIGIFIFNAICMYILMEYVLETEEDELFYPMIYMIAHKYKGIVLYIYNIFNK